MLLSGGVLSVYFIRHGQAGSRQEYDRLSDLGREQSGRLGRWFARQEIRFDQAWSGRLARQRETAEQVRGAYCEGGAEFPEVAVSDCWDEFDLDGVYRDIAPQLAHDDAEFRRRFEELQLEMQDAGSRVHRAWSHCDTTVVRCWIEGRYSHSGESFTAFADRVRSASKIWEVLQEKGARKVAVFTSATPAAIWAAMALDLDGRKIMQLAGVTYNTAYSVVRVEGERVRLFQFNAVPHLDAPALLTHR